MAKKSKAKKNPDFQKTKLKAGKSKIPSNATNTAMTVKNIQIVQKIKNSEENNSYENFLKALSQLRHHAAKMRISGLEIMKSILTESIEYIKVLQESEVPDREQTYFGANWESEKNLNLRLDHTSDNFLVKFPEITILSNLGQLLADTDHGVRQACVKCFEVFYKRFKLKNHSEIGSSNMPGSGAKKSSTRNTINTDFANQILAYINCGLNHNDPRIAAVCLKVFEMILLDLPINEKFTKILMSSLDLCCSTEIKYSNIGISFIEKAGKFCRLIKG